MPKSPRGGGKSLRGEGGGGVPLFDPEVQAATAAAAPKKASQKVTQVSGSRFRVKMILEDGSERRAVAIISPESITLVDPTTDTGGNSNAVHYRSCKWPGIASITSKQDTVKIFARDNTLIELIVTDSSAFIAEINAKRDAAAAQTSSEGGKEDAGTGSGDGSNAPAAAADDDDDESVEVLNW